MADLRFAAWFWWMTPLLTALSSFFDAVRRALDAAALSPEAMAVRVARTAVLTSLLTALLRSWAFLFVPMRLICDLMFATLIRSFVCVWIGCCRMTAEGRPRENGVGGHPHAAQRGLLPYERVEPIIVRSGSDRGHGRV